MDQMDDDSKLNCPRCNGECRRDEVHNGVAWLYGPWGCFDCGWSEWEEYDQTKIEQPADGHIDQWGGFTRRHNGNKEQSSEV
jgi:hypothetical protein